MTDAASLSCALGTLYDSVIDPQRWPAALAEMSSFVGGSSALLFHQDLALGQGDFFYSHNADPNWTRLYFEKYIPLNPVLPLAGYMEVGACAALSGMLDVNEYKSSQFYVEWAAPQRFLDVVVTVLDKSSTAMGMFGVTRMVDEGLAGPTEVARMELLAPHLRRAVTMARLFRDLGVQAKDLGSTVESLRDAVLLMRADAGVAFANTAARALDPAVLSLRGGKLSFRDPAASEALAAALRGLSESSDGGSGAEFPVEDAEADRLMAYVVPLGTAAQLGRGTVAALFLRRLQPPSLPPLEALARAYDLTPREFQVLNGLLRFGGVPEVARIFGISGTTVRSHVQAIFDKTGLRSQAELAQLVAATMPPASRPPD